MSFSVVVPVYNVESFIEECIDSILNQCDQTDEIILVDDGSTDNSGAICDRYVSEYPCNIQVIHNDNRGQLQSRCCGVRRATGDIILFVDSDDCLREDAFEKIRRRFEEDRCDLLLFNASRECDYRTAWLDLPFENTQCFTGDEKKAVYEVMIVSSKLNSLCIKAVHRDVAIRCIDKYQSFAERNGEDLLQSLPIVTLAQKIGYLAEPLYYYRPRSGSVVHTYNPARHKSIKAVHKEMEKYIDVWGMPEMHPQHFAREVKGWIECLKQVLLCASREETDRMMIELAEDEYFRHAYQLMVSEALSEEESLMACLLYKKKFGLLKIVKMILRLKLKLKSMLRK